VSETQPPKVLTPLVGIITIVVVAFGIANLVLLPELKWRGVLGMLFLPLAITAIHVLTRGEGRMRRAIGGGGGVRAGLVGAGVALATAFGFTFTDHMGWTGAEGQLSSSPIWLILLPTIAVLIELFSARLEARAGKDLDQRND